MATHNPLAFFNDAQRELGIDKSKGSGFGEGAAGARRAEGLSPHTLVFCEPELLNAASVPARVHVVGPCLAPDARGPEEHLVPWLDGAHASGQRVLYVAFGTLGNGFLTEGAVGTLLDAFEL